jgi:hypothetical protein
MVLVLLIGFFVNFVFFYLFSPFGFLFLAPSVDFLIAFLTLSKRKKKLIIKIKINK